MVWTVQNFSVGQVLTAAQMNNLNANNTAAMNGDTGAPPLQLDAFKNSVSGATFEVAKSDTLFTEVGSVLVKKNEIYTPRNGILEVSFTLRSGLFSGSQAEGQIHVNGSPVGTLRSITNFATTNTYTEDITGLVAGDLVQVYIRDSGTASAAECEDLILREATPYEYVVVA